MQFRFINLILLAALLSSFQIAQAAGLVDVNDDVEELTNEADAAAASTREVKARIAEERAQAEAALQKVKSNRDSAVSRRQAAVDQLKRSESEIDRVNAERARMNAEIERLNNETAATEKAHQETLVRLEKTKADLKSLQDLRGEKAKMLIELSTQSEKVTESLQELEKQKAAQEQEFTELKEKERLSSEHLAKTKAEHAQKKARLEAHIASMKERYKEARERILANQNEQNDYDRSMQMLEAQAQTATNEVKLAEEKADGKIHRAAAGESPAAVPLVEMVFTRKCRVFDGPTKGANVVGIQPEGTAVSRTDEGKSWVAFPLSDGRKAFASKGCFR